MLPGGVQRDPQARASRKQGCALQAVSTTVQTVADAWGRRALWTLGQLLPPRPAVGRQSLITRAGVPRPHREPGNQRARVGCLGKVGGPLHAMSPGKSPPLSLSFPKVCPSGLGHLLAGAALAVPRLPAQQSSNPHAPIPHTPRRLLASRAQTERRRRRSLHTAGSCRAGCPSRGHRSLEPATSLIGKSYGAAWAGQELACQALAAPFHHWASQSPTMCWALWQALGQRVGSRLTSG